MSRPRRDPSAPAARRVAVRVTDAELADLRAAAAENRSTVARLLRDAVDQVVADFRDRRVFVRRNPGPAPR